MIVVEHFSATASHNRSFMKYLIFTLILFSNLVHAENWLNHSKIKSGSVEAYSLKSDCERISGEKCFDIGEYPSSVYSEVDVEVDDYEKPIYSKRDTESCTDESDCSAKFLALVCTQNDYEKIKNLDLLQVYCVKLAGYEKKYEKTIQLDSQKLSAWQSQEANKATERAREMAIQTALKRIECGKRVIGLLVVRNASKTLTTAQIGQINTVYAPIKGLIDTGSLVTAKEQMQAITPDELLITTEDKNDLIQEITKCI